MSHHKPHKIWFRNYNPFISASFLTFIFEVKYSISQNYKKIQKGVNEVSIFAISDLHLSFGVDKPMDIFKGWENHTEQIRANWCRLVKENDTVVLAGDFSWGLKIEETLEDFKFLESLPGKKILIKGNHDLWWSTARKIKKFWEENNIKSCEIVFNNCAIADGYAIAGTRGWFYDEQGTKKVKLREAGRLETSLKAAIETGFPVLVFLHYPPAYCESISEEIMSVLKKYEIKRVYHGHIHGAGFNNAISECDGVELRLISCDCTNFTPTFIV